MISFGMIPSMDMGIVQFLKNMSTTYVYGETM